MKAEKPNIHLSELYSAVLNLRTRGECENFFRDLCTLNELKALAERWQVAKLVDQEIPYRKISEETGASTATITRVAHWLHHGQGGYRLLLRRCK